jgi:hypothetical protein
VAAIDDIIAAQDALYGYSGVSASWTPVGGSPVSCAALLTGGQQPGMISVGAKVVMDAFSVRIRVRELAAATDVIPAKNDPITIDGRAWLIGAAPEKLDPRGLEYTLQLAKAAP